MQSTARGWRGDFNRGDGCWIGLLVSAILIPLSLFGCGGSQAGNGPSDAGASDIAIPMLCGADGAGGFVANGDLGECPASPSLICGMGQAHCDPRCPPQNEGPCPCPGLVCQYFEETCSCDRAGRSHCVFQGQGGPDMSVSDLGPPDMSDGCMDHLRDGDESDVDCGGLRCARCGNARRCVTRDDCQSGHCAGRTCFRGRFAPGPSPGLPAPMAGDFVTMIAADLDGDGHVDLALGENVLGLKNSLTVLLGVGDGTFGAASSYPSNPLVGSIAAGDVDKDGLLDLVVSNYGFGNDLASTATVMRGAGGGRFPNGVQYPTHQGTEQLGLGDVNGDGALDIIACNFNSKDLSVLLNDGHGLFRAPTAFAADGYCLALAIGDFNRDGFADTAALTDGTVQLFTGSAPGTLNALAVIALVPQGVQARSILAGDFNNDGRPDLVVAVATAGFAGELRLFPGDGQGGFGAPITTDTLLQPHALAAADFNHDCALDLAVLRYDETVLPLLGHGDGTFTADIDYLTSGQSIVTADVNGDHQPDLVTSKAPVTILINTD